MVSEPSFLGYPPFTANPTFYPPYHYTPPPTSPYIYPSLPPPQPPHQFYTLQPPPQPSSQSHPSTDKMDSHQVRLQGATESEIREPHQVGPPVSFISDYTTSASHLNAYPSLFNSADTPSIYISPSTYQQLPCLHTQHVFYSNEPPPVLPHNFGNPTISAPMVFDINPKREPVVKDIVLSPSFPLDSTRVNSSGHMLQGSNNLPNFDGTDPRGWILKALRYFDFKYVIDVEKIKESGLCFIGRASTWFKCYYQKPNENAEWKLFLHHLLVRFDDSEVDLCYLVNPLGIEQRCSVDEYEIEFSQTKELSEYVYNFMFTEEMLAHNFINGLKEEIRETIDVWSLKTLQGAVNWAKFQELLIEERLLFEATEEEYEMYEGMKRLFKEDCATRKATGGCVEGPGTTPMRFLKVDRSFGEVEVLYGEFQKMDVPAAPNVDCPTAINSLSLVMGRKMNCVKGIILVWFGNVLILIFDPGDNYYSQTCFLNLHLWGQKCCEIRAIVSNRAYVLNSKLLQKFSSSSHDIFQVAVLRGQGFIQVQDWLLYEGMKHIFKDHLDLVVHQNHNMDMSQLVVTTPIMQNRTLVHAPTYELVVGQEFPDVKSCRRARRDCAIALHFEIQTVKSDTTRFTAKCASEGCPWRIHAARLPGVPTFTIRTIHAKHICGGIAHLGHQQASVQWVASSVEHRLKKNPQCKPKEILEEIHCVHGITLSCKQAWRGKERIMAAHRLLPLYCEQIKRTNPGSIASVYVKTMCSCFQRLFISFQASIYGFLNAYRPLIGLDRMVLKSKYLGTLLFTTGFDGDGVLFPLAFGVVDDENDDNWMWFLSELHNLLEINTENMPKLTILSDRQKSIVDGVESNFPTAFHGFCMRHLTESFRKEFNNTVLVNLLQEAASALTVIKYEGRILEIEEISQEAAYWIHRIPPRLWATAYFEGTRFGHLTANIVESLNTWILEVSGLPIIQMMECIRRQLMTWFNERREVSMQWRSILVPCAERRMSEALERAQTYQVLRANEEEFKVIVFRKLDLADVLAKLTIFTVVLEEKQTKIILPKEVCSVDFKQYQQTTGSEESTLDEFKLCVSRVLPKVLVAKNMVMAWYWSIVTLVFDPGVF